MNERAVASRSGPYYSLLLAGVADFSDDLPLNPTLTVGATIGCAWFASGSTVERGSWIGGKGFETRLARSV